MIATATARHGYAVLDGQEVLPADAVEPISIAARLAVAIGDVAMERRDVALWQAVAMRMRDVSLWQAGVITRPVWVARHRAR